MTRTKCVNVKAYSSAPRDPVLVKGRFYTVIDSEVYTIADETPFIRVLVGRKSIERPRHMFGPILTDKCP